MKNKTSPLLLSTAIFSFCLAAPALSQTVTTETSTHQVPPTQGRMINIKDFDLNKDNILSTFEVGEMLFKFFDNDSNGVIDTAEYEHRGILTVVPMEKETTITYDYNNDNLADKISHTFETFLQETQLARFDKNKDGLSPHEFIDNNFMAIDSNNSRNVDVTEWRNAYISRIAPVLVQ